MPRLLWTEHESLARRLALLPLLAAEGPYRVGAWLHRQSYTWGLRHRVRLGARVISVGNLTVGGSGKTPVAAWIARELRNRGRKVAILSRGVRGRRRADVNVVSDGERVLLPPAEVGDEPVWSAGAAPGVQVLAGVNRVALGLRATAVFGAEVLILDDGFQHHRLYRDLDLLCLDGRSGLANGHVLPRGPLRESAGNMSRADAILWTRIPSNLEQPPQKDRIPPGLPQFRIDIVPRGMRKLGAREIEPITSLQGADIGVLTAIARPDRFVVDLERLGARVVEIRRYPDHHPYRREDLQSLTPGLCWVTTGKDAVKLPFVWATGRRVYVLEEEVRPNEPTQLLDWVMSRIDASRKNI